MPRSSSHHLSPPKGAGKRDGTSRHAGFVELLRAVTVAANEATDLETPLRVTLEAICDHTGWPVGHVFTRANEPPYDLVPSDIWHLADPERFAVFREITEKTRLAPGVGLPGTVLASGRPQWFPDITRHPNFPRARLAKDIGVRTGFGFPIRVGPEIPAVLEFFTDVALPPDAEFLEVMDVVGTLLGRVIERMRAEDALRNLAGGVSAAKGDAFFLSLANHLMRAIKADNVFIGALAGEMRDKVKILAAVGRDGILDRFEYPLEGTPCESVIDASAACVYPRDVQRLFPGDKDLATMQVEAYCGSPLRSGSGKSVGLMVALFRRPLTNPGTVEALLRVFAVRAATELERQRVQHSLDRLALYPRADPNPVLEFTTDGTLTYYNAATEKLARSLGKDDPRDILPADTPGLVRRCLETGLNGIVMETTGGDRTISWAFIPVAHRGVVLAYAVEISFLLTLESEMRRLHLLDPPASQPETDRRPRHPLEEDDSPVH
jgi:GAF domain-containing protein